MRVLRRIGARLPSHKGRLPAIMVAGLAALLGAWLVQTGSAATFVAHKEAEAGTLSGNAGPGDVTGASAGASVKFGATTTPTPPPPPPPGGKPSATTTGVPAGTQLTVVNGNQTYSTAGQVISGLDIHGKVTINASNVTLKNSIIRGPGAGGCVNGAGLDIAGGTGITIQDSEIIFSNPTACLDGISAQNVTLLRMHIHSGVDGLKVWDNVTIKDSYIHDLNYFASDPNQGGGETHNDGLQSYGCSANILVQGNNIDLGSMANANADYQLTQDEGVRCANINITGNWLNGGGCSLNVAPKVLSTLTGVSITNNKFGRQRAYPNCVVKAYAGVTLAAYTGNVWEDTGQPVPQPEP